MGELHKFHKNLVLFGIIAIATGAVLPLPNQITNRNLCPYFGAPYEGSTLTRKL